MLSTGSPLAPESFDWVYRAVKQDLQLASISGGTDIVSCFVLGNPAGPVRRGEIQMRGLGLAVEVWDDAGQAGRGREGRAGLHQAVPVDAGEVLERPGRQPLPRRLLRALPGVWCHGDYAELTEHGGVIIHGRSDAVLNPGGVRIGTAEIYRQVEQVPEVMEAICVGQDWQGDVRVVLFVRLREGESWATSSSRRSSAASASTATPRHVPARIVQVADIPRTRSGKITELAVRDAIHGRPVKNTEAAGEPRGARSLQPRPAAELKSQLPAGMEC